MNKKKVCISRGNRKMGAVPSVSLPPGTTCPFKCPGCYAEKMCRIYPNVRASYERNLEIYLEDPDEYFRQINEVVAVSHFFRFHVSGDIPDYGYLERMVETARENPHCEILAFTKRDKYVNRWQAEHGEFPKNLHMTLSPYRDFVPENPYNLPEAHVRFKDGYCKAREDAVECYGNCFECYIAGCGCWKLKKGEQVVFKQH